MCYKLRIEGSVRVWQILIGLGFTGGRMNGRARYEKGKNRCKQHLRRSFKSLPGMKSALTTANSTTCGLQDRPVQRPSNRPPPFHVAVVFKAPTKLQTVARSIKY
jgi:hypothetical protein